MNGLRIFLLVILILGITFRWINLDKKVYWYDETYTSIPIAGYTKEELETEWIDRIQNNQDTSFSTLQQYQYPNSEKNVMDTLRSVAIEEPQNSPLYFLIARIWIQLFGNSITGTRSIAVVLGLIAIPCFYWLCRELFQSAFSAAIGTALFAISPFHILYAQESRQYSLLTVFILLSSSTLLQAIRRNTRRSWGFYAASLALGLYTHFFFAFVAIAQGLYLLLSEKRRWNLVIKNYLIASSVSLLLYAPWLYFIVTNLGAIADWRSTNIGVLPLMGRWLLNLSRIVVDLPSQTNLFDLQFSLKNPIFGLAIAVFGLVVYAFYSLFKKAPQNVWILITLLIGTTALPLVFPDLVSGGIRSAVPRYLIPCYLGIQLAIAYAVSDGLMNLHSRWKPRIWQAGFALLITAGVVSNVLIASTESWWNKYSGYYDPEIAEILNRSSDPSVVSSNAVRLLSLGHLLNPKIPLQITDEDDRIFLQNLSEEVFIFDDNAEFSLALEQKQECQLELVYDQDMQFIKRQIRLWKVLNKDNRSCLRLTKAERSNVKSK